MSQYVEPKKGDDLDPKEVSRKISKEAVCCKTDSIYSTLASEIYLRALDLLKEEGKPVSWGTLEKQLHDAFDFSVAAAQLFETEWQDRYEDSPAMA